MGADKFRGRRGLRQRLFAWWFAGSDSASRLDDAVDDQRRRLLADLRGTVLEIGAGAGANFSFFAPDIDWIGIEPNLFLHPHLERAAREHGFRVDIRAQEAEALDLADSSVDAVVATHVLCSVRQPARALSEIWRVLKPGGRFVFIEHVAAPPATLARHVQNLVVPLWSLVGDGCHPNRETAQAVEQAGFSSVQIETFSIPWPVVAPHIAGVAIK